MEMEGRETYTVDGALMALGFGKFQYMVLMYAGMGWISEAMEIMLLSFVGPAVKSQWGVTSQQESLISSSVFGGMLVGAYSWGLVSDRYGRRRGFLMTALVTSAAGFLSSFAPNYICLVILRCLVGVGLGGGPVLLSWFLEFIPAPKRGFWMVVFSAFWTLGTVLEATLAWVVMPRLGWRWLLGLSSVPTFFLLVFYTFTPESPRYLCLQDKKSKAIDILNQIARLNGTQLPPGILVTDYEFEQSTSNAHLGESHEVEGVDVVEEKNVRDQNSKPKGGLKILMLLSPQLIRPTLLLWVIFFGNAFAYYGLVLLTTELNNEANKCGSTTRANSTSKSRGVNYLGVMITSFAEFPGLIFAALTVDKLGRKISMSSMFITCALVLIPLLFHQSPRWTTVILFGARICITATFTVVYIYAPELYPTSVRSTGIGVGSAMGRIGGMICPLVAVGLIHGCHQTIAIALFQGVVFIAAIGVLLLPVETKGRHLRDHIVKISATNDTP